MADKQLARSGTAEFDVLSEDDPLAELARIVGYDNRPAVQQLQELERHRDSVRVEPVLDLEDELLREFDAYDAPQDGAMDAPEPVSAENQIAFAPFPEESDFEPVAVIEPEFVAYEPEDLRPEASAEVAAPTVEIASLAAEEPALAEPEAAVASVDDEPRADVWSPEPVSPESENAWSLDQYSEPVFDAADLERELELSIGYDAYPVEAPRIETVSPQTQRVGSELDTLVDARAEEPAEQDVAPSPAFEEPVAPAAVEDFQFGADQSAEAPVESEVQTQGDLPERQPEPASALKSEEVTSSANAHDIDALLTDIEQFPVPAKAAVKLATPADAARKINYPFTPTFSRATPVASNGGVLSQKAFATPLPTAAVAAAATVTEAAYQSAETPVEPVVTEAAPVLKVPADQEPDFDLDTFELDLSGIDLDLDPSEFETVAQETAFAPAAAIAEEPISIAAAPAAPVDEIPQDEEPENALPFDPAMIAETEESLTAIADLNVPQLPAVEQERPVAHQPDYDLDIDAEMAQLFGTPSRSGAAANRGADDDGLGSVPHSVPQARSVTEGAPAEDDFDEFEKAMEEDFRLSLSKRHEADPSSDRLAVGSGYAASSDFDEEGSGAGKRRSILLAAAVTGLAIFGGLGVYAFMGGNGSVLSGGEPKIILADKSPVKIVPVEKGGKTVPNQDKAVYDRVAGAQDGAPEQGTLVSSTEEPVDVVQRTLTPESLPLEGAGEDVPGLTPADEDGSERLLPDGHTAENTTAEEDSSSAVSPRKVRTMIVKPDGTLVAREDPVAQPETKVAANQTPANQGDPQIKTVKTTAVTPQVETGSTPKSLPAANQVAADQAAAPEQKSALAEAAATTVEETAPVRSVKTTAVADTNPIPQTRPVEEQAKVEEKTNVVDTFKTEPTQQAQPATEAKSVETAAVAPGTYVMQIASLPSEAEAQKSYKTLSGKFGSVIGGKGVDIKKAEIAGKGTYFRVRIPVGSREEANALCARYKSAGGSCLVTK